MKLSVNLTLTVALLVSVGASMTVDGKYVRCNEEKLHNGNWYAALNTALNQMKDEAADYKDESPTHQGHKEDATLFAKSYCSLEQSKCEECISKLADDSWQDCGNSVGGFISRDGCAIRWERYLFQEKVKE